MMYSDVVMEKSNSNTIVHHGIRVKLEHFLKDIKNTWNKTYGEGTQFDLDYGKLVILGLCIYIAVMVSGCHTVGM